jgi:hypothetical protein
MKCFKLAVLALFLVCNLAVAADYIRIDVDSVPTNSQNVSIDFYLIRECPVPTSMMGMTNAFVFTATGDATWEFLGSYPDDLWFWQCPPLGLLFTIMFDDVSPDTICAALVCMPLGIPVFTEEVPYFSLLMNIGPGEGEICVDSASIWPECGWKWSGMTCGQGGAPDRPLFLDKYGSDDNHPICITIYDQPIKRGDADGNGEIDIDDVVYLIAYIFSGGPPPNPVENGDADCSEDVDIDDVVYLVNYIFAEGPSPCAPGEPTVISGTMIWPDHELTHPYAFIDTCHSPYVSFGHVTAADGQGNFTIQLDLDAPLEVRIEGWDDVNDNSFPDSGESFGWWDANGNGTWDDYITLLPGQVLSGIVVEMRGIILSPDGKAHMTDVSIK